MEIFYQINLKYEIFGAEPDRGVLRGFPAGKISNRSPIEGYFTVGRTDEASQIFTLFQANNNIKQTVLQTTFQNSSTVQPPISATTVPHTTQSASLPLALPIVVFVVIVILKSIQKKKNDD
jgi:hypothetical protein